MEKIFNSIRTQYRACYKRMAFDGMRWNLHCVPGTDRFTIFREDAEFNGANLPLAVRDIHAMTEQTLINKVHAIIRGN